MLLADDLKKAVMQAAIQGKLVEQRPEEGEAKDLFAYIQETKSKLIKEKAIKKEKVLSNISDDETPFEIPNSWMWVRLGELTSKIGAGSTPSGGAKAGIYTDTGIPFIREMNVYDDGIHIDGMVHISKELSDSRLNSKFYTGDLLLNITGGSIGRCAIVPEDIPIGDVNQHVEIIRLIDKRLSAYIHMIICSPYVQAIINSRSVGDKAGFSAEKCKNIEIPLPPIAEQQRIVNRLNVILDEVDTYGKAETELESLQKAFPNDIKKSVLQYAMQGKLVEQRIDEGTGEELYKDIVEEKNRLVSNGRIKKEKPLADIKDDEVPFDIPESWKWVRLGSLMQVISDGTHKTPKYVKEGVPFLSVQNISKGYFDLDNIKYITVEEHEKLVQRVKPQKGDILFCRIGTLGKAIKCTLDFEFSIFVSLGLLRPVDDTITDYIIMVINSPVGDRWIKENKVGGGTHTFKINLTDIPNMLIPLPPLMEQRRIVEKLQSILPLVDKLSEVV